MDVRECHMAGDLKKGLPETGRGTCIPTGATINVVWGDGTCSWSTGTQTISMFKKKTDPEIEDEKIEAYIYNNIPADYYHMIKRKFKRIESKAYEKGCCDTHAEYDC